MLKMGLFPSGSASPMETPSALPSTAARGPSRYAKSTIFGSMLMLPSWGPLGFLINTGLLRNCWNMLTPWTSTSQNCCSMEQEEHYLWSRTRKRSLKHLEAHLRNFLSSKTNLLDKLMLWTTKTGSLVSPEETTPSSSTTPMSTTESRR